MFFRTISVSGVRESSQGVRESSHGAGMGLLIDVEVVVKGIYLPPMMDLLSLGGQARQSDNLGTRIYELSSHR